jgi:CRP/FNR family cyclic AMP-dependent transcriptional regulator
MRSERAAALIANSPLFAELPEEILVSLAEGATERRYGKGEHVFHQGDPGDSLFVLVEGRVKVVVTSEGGGEMVLVTLRPPDTFGELAVVDGRPRSATAETIEATIALSVARSTLLQVLSRHREVADELLRSLGAIVRRLTDQAGDLVFLDLHGRVAKLLLRLAEDEGRTTEDGISLDLRITQRDLANMVGGSRQSVNQILHVFQGRGYLEIGPRAIVLKEVEGLKRRAGG